MSHVIKYNWQGEVWRAGNLNMANRTERTAVGNDSRYFKLEALRPKLKQIVAKR